MAENYTVSPEMMAELRRSVGKKDFNMTELGTAERLLDENSGDIRYCPDMGMFLLWDGMRWKRDTDGEIHRLAMKTVRGLYDCSDSTEPERQVKWARTCESRAKLESIVELVKRLPNVPVGVGDLDTSKYLVNCLNGTIDLQSGVIRSHDRADNITHLLPFEYRLYDAERDCMQWVKFLCEVMPEKTEVIRYLWKLAGLCLSGDTSEHVLNIFHGSAGRNGKGVFLGTLQKILGELACVMPFATFETKQGGGIPNDIARLAGKRLVIAQESAEGKRLDEALVKALTGGDRLTGRFLRQEYFDFWPTHKIILASNNRPVIRETSNAIWTRLRLIPFEVSFAGREDHQLENKLEKELPEIFAWCVAGFAAWQREGLTMPDTVKAACLEYRSEEDTVQAFIEDCCYVNESVSVSRTALFERLTEWAARNGEKPVPRRVLFDRLESRGYVQFGSGGVRKFRGLAIRDIRDRAG